MSELSQRPPSDSGDALDRFFEEMLADLLGWRWESAWEKSQVDAVEKKWRDKWAEAREAYARGAKGGL